MSGWADLVNKNLDELVDEKEGYKLYPNAKFPFTKERAEEFAKVGLEQLIDDPYFLNQKWNGEQGVWPKIKDMLLDFEQTRKSKLLNTFLFTGSIGIGKCSKYNSLCITNRGILTAEEVYNDDSVTQMVSEDGLKPIESKLEEGELEGIELTYNNGITSTTTGHHRLRVWTEEAKIEWKYVDDINVGDYVIFTPNTNNVWGTRTEIDGFELTEARCEVMGLWVAEGLKISKNVCGLSSGENKEELDQLFIKANITTRYIGCYNNAHRYQFYNDFAIVINKYFNTGSSNKNIPQIIRELPKNLLCAFLRGMFAGDGCFKISKNKERGTISYSSVSKQLIDTLSVLLVYLGIRFAIYTDNRKYRKNYKTTYNLEISSNNYRNKFKSLIGTIFERRKEALNNCCLVDIMDNSKKDNIPFTNKLNINYFDIPIKYRSHKYINSKKLYNIFSSIRHGDNNGVIGLSNIQFLLNEPYDILPDILKYIYNQGYWIVQVVDKKQVKERMFDFSIKDDPSYIANGLINHNTSVSNIMAYWQFFEIVILPDMHAYFGMMRDKWIAFCILSKDADAAKRVTFLDLMPVFTASPFIRDYYPPHLSLEKISNNPSKMPRELRFPKNITIFPGSGSSASALGYSTYCATLDEINDMAWVESSTKARMKQYYSAAEESYREITERMNSRFPWETLHRQGKKHGFITCIGQARFPDSFTEKKILEASIMGNESAIYWVKASRWEMQPKERFSRETFIIDKTNKRVIDFLTIDRYPDLLTQRCPVCKGFLAKGAYVGNNGMLVCGLDCYKETYFSKITIEKEKA